jgi:hypothetical protein
MGHGGDTDGIGDVGAWGLHTRPGGFSASDPQGGQQSWI